MENPIKMDDLGGNPTIFGNIQIWGPVKNATADGTDGVDSLMEGDEGTKRKAHVLSEWAWYFSPGNLWCKMTIWMDVFWTFIYVVVQFQYCFFTNHW